MIAKKKQSPPGKAKYKITTKFKNTDDGYKASTVETGDKNYGPTGEYKSERGQRVKAALDKAQKDEKPIATDEKTGLKYRAGYSGKGMETKADIDVDIVKPEFKMIKKLPQPAKSGTPEKEKKPLPKLKRMQTVAAGEGGTKYYGAKRKQVKGLRNNSSTHGLR